MSDVYVSHLASALGSDVWSVRQSAAAERLVSAVDALQGAGFERHYICTESESGYDLAARAFEASGIEAEAVDLIVYSTCLPQNGSCGDSRDFESGGDVKHLMRFPASRLQGEFGMHRATTIGLNQQACTGMLGALRIARNMLRAEAELQRVLCITADRFPPGAKYEQAYNLISDGAAACQVSREPAGLRLRDVHHISNGAMVGASGEQSAASYFSYSCRVIEELLERTGIHIRDVRWVVPQNVNRTAWQVLCDLLNLDPSQAYCPPTAALGHVISADNIINLADLCNSGLLRSGDRILTFMAGYGSHWQCAMLEAV